MKLRFIFGIFLVLAARELSAQEPYRLSPMAIREFMQAQYELSCPSGTSNMNQLSPTFDTSTSKYRQWACVDALGNVTLQGIPGIGGATVNPGVAGQILTYTTANTVDGNPGLTINGVTSIIPNLPFMTTWAGCSPPAYGGNSSNGFTLINAGSASICTNALERTRFEAGRVTLQSTYIFSWNNVTPFSGPTTPDTTIARPVPGWLEVGTNGVTANSLGGIIASANSCTFPLTTTPFTDTTPVTVCTLNIPAIAKNWLIACTDAWNIGGIGSGTTAEMRASLVTSSTFSTPTVFVTEFLDSAAGTDASRMLTLGTNGGQLGDSNPTAALTNQAFRTAGTFPSTAAGGTLSIQFVMVTNGGAGSTGIAQPGGFCTMR